jgi:hypothetical protein
MNALGADRACLSTLRRAVGFMQDRRARGGPKAGLPWAHICASAWGACTVTWLLLRQWHLVTRPALLRWASSIAARRGPRHEL